MNKRLIRKIENKLKSIKAPFTEFPIFLIKENNAFIMSKYLLSILNISTKDLKKSNIEDDSYLLDVNNPLINIVEPESKVYFKNTPYSALII
jgi:hypothetical protein